MKDTRTPYEVYFKTFLGGWSFADGDRTLTIKSIDKQEMYDMETGGKKTGITLRFEEEDLPMVMNVTNAETIATVLGTNIVEDWIGHQIVVGMSKVKAFGKIHDAIRVRPEKPAAIICEECGQVVKPGAGKTALELADYSRSKTGKVMCLDCMKKAADKQKEGESVAE